MRICRKDVAPDAQAALILNVAIPVPKLERTPVVRWSPIVLFAP